MTNCTHYYQQGDVLLKRIDQLPEGATKMLNTKVLQLGEVTGHKHQFATEAKVDIYVDAQFAGQEMSITPDEGKFIVVFGDEPMALRHEEHRTIMVPPGTYQVDIVREFDYEAMEARRVVD